MSIRTWKVLPASEEDAESLVQLTVRTLAAADTTTTQYKDIPTFVYPKEREHLTSPEDLFAHRVRTRRKVITSEGIHTYKVVHPSETGRIIGTLMWKDPVNSLKSKHSSEKEVENPKSVAAAPSPSPASLDQEAMKYLAETMETVQKEIWGSNGSDAPYLCTSYFKK
jgi:hypothetical protein